MQDNLEKERREARYKVNETIASSRIQFEELRTKAPNGARADFYSNTPARG